MSTDKKDTLHSRGSILRSTSVMSVGTLLSRILGFIRDIIFARFFGTAAGADAFVVAFRLPNLFRDLLGEGAANSSFVPVMTEYKKKRPEELKGFLNAVFSWAAVILGVITVAGIIFAPQIVRAIAPGFTQDPGKLELTVTLTRIMFPYLLLIGLTAFLSAVQFTYGAFVWPAFGPCLLNIALIASTLMAVFWMKQPLYGLAWGVIAGGFLQFYVQFRAVRTHGLRPTVTNRWSHPGAKEVGRLLVPRMVGSAVYQLNVFVDTICASLVWIVGPGGIAAVYFANRIVLFPMGIFGVAIASASLPAFSSHALAEDKAEFRRAVRFSLENIIFLMLPMTVAMVLLAEPIVRVLFQRGVFDADSTMQTSVFLLFSAVGLTFFGMARILATAFHSLKDTRTPVKVALGCLVINVILNVTLMFPMKLAGIALASTIASMVNVAALYRALRARVGALEGGLKGCVEKVLLAGMVQALATWGTWLGLGGVPEWLRLMAAIVLGGGIYLATAWLLGLEQARKFGTVFSFKK
jgi:putative peptidoglycan lipid II flippase